MCRTTWLCKWLKKTQAAGQLFQVQLKLPVNPCLGLFQTWLWQVIAITLHVAEKLGMLALGQLHNRAVKVAHHQESCEHLEMGDGSVHETRGGLVTQEITGGAWWKRFDIM